MTNHFAVEGQDPIGWTPTTSTSTTTTMTTVTTSTVTATTMTPVAKRRSYANDQQPEMVFQKSEKHFHVEILISKATER